MLITLTALGKAHICSNRLWKDFPVLPLKASSISEQQKHEDVAIEEEGMCACEVIPC